MQVVAPVRYKVSLNKGGSIWWLAVAFDFEREREKEKERGNERERESDNVCV